MLDNFKLSVILNELPGQKTSLGPLLYQATIIVTGNSAAVHGAIEAVSDMFGEISGIKKLITRQILANGILDPNSTAGRAWS